MATIDLILFIVRTALAIIESKVTGKALAVPDAILSITSAAYAAYEAEAGQPLDQAKIKPFTPIP
jgi:hypothetical protein